MAAQFVVVGELAVAGAEADVVLVDGRDGRRSVVKLYRRGIAPDEDAVGRLSEADPAHVVRIEQRGWADGCWFEVLEACEAGSLRSLMDAGSVPPLPDVIREIATALEHVHSLGLVHRDLKPENVLVRTLSPCDLVLADFGLVRAIEGSVRWTRAWGTPAYSPPEFDAGEVTTSWDWWSLGMIIAEIAGGRHPFEDPSGLMMSDRQIRSSLAQRPVDLDAVTDTRVAHLCRGLLTRDRRHRWGVDEVMRWLGGASPALIEDEAPAAAWTRQRTVLFDGAEHTSAAELGQAFQAHWSEAQRRLYQERDDVLIDEVQRMLRAEHLDEASRALTAPSNPTEIPRRFATLLAEMAPEIAPIYDGLDLTPAGLEANAIEVIQAAGDHPAARKLDDVRRHSILLAWRTLPGMEVSPAIQEAWTLGNADLEAAFERCETHGFKPSPGDWAVARAWLLACSVNPDQHRSELAAAIVCDDTRDASQQDWWRTLRHTLNPSVATQVTALVTRPAATEQTQRQREEERRRQEGEAAARREREERERREKEERLERDRQASRSSRRRIDKALITLFFLAVATYELPLLLGREVWRARLTDANADRSASSAALATAEKYVPDATFGALVLVGVLGLLLLRPRWSRTTTGFRLFGAVCLLAGASCVPASNAIESAFVHRAERIYALGPIPTSRLVSTCGSDLTSDRPRHGSYIRTTLVSSTDRFGEGGCTELNQYSGWRVNWVLFAPRNSIFYSLGFPGRHLVVRDDVGGHPNVLLGVSYKTGHIAWRWQCPGPANPSFLTSEEYHPSYVEVRCADGRHKISPRTGRTIS